MNDRDGQIDDELRAAGERWRASRPTHDGGIDPALMVGQRAQEPRAGRLLASVAGVALLAVVGAVVLFVFASRAPDHAVSVASPSPTAAATMPGSSPSFGPSSSLGPSPTVAPIPTVAAPSPNPAEVACSAILDNIPSTVVKSGDATLAAAYEVTGAQLTSYFVRTLNANANQSNGSDWWDQPAKLVDMCLYDGDFDTQTPGPPGHDTSAVRVLVVISDGDAQLWAITRDKAALPTTDPATMSRGISADEAIAKVVAFVADPALTDDLSAQGPMQGAAGDYFEVSGAHINASVDAVSGTVTTLLFLDSASPSPTRLTEDEASAIAAAFLTEQGVSVDGMTRSVELVDHGETKDYVVKWIRTAGDVILPDWVEVDIHESGQVYNYVAYRRPYSSIPAPQIDRATAEAAAINAAFPDSTNVQVDSAELHLTVTADNVQHLVWEVQVTGPVAMGSGPPAMIAHAIVEVDAETGVATVTARG